MNAQQVSGAREARKEVSFCTCSFRPVTASRQHGALRWILQPDPHLMQSGMRVAGSETQQIPAVQVIGEIVHADFESLARREQLILTASHRGHRAGHVFSQNLAGLISEIEKV